MKKKSVMPLIYNQIKNGCLIFTIITFIGYILRPVLGVSSGTPFGLFQLILLFFFSVMLAASNLLLKNHKISMAVRILLHFAVCSFLYFTFIVLFTGKITEGTQTIIAMALFLFIYLIFAAIYITVNSFKGKKRNKKETYDSVFK